MLDRREFLIGAGCAAFGCYEQASAADMLIEAPNGPVVLGPDYRGPLPADRFSKRDLPPSNDEERIARQILQGAPRSSPLAIMRYFAGITRRNSDGEAYNAGWHTRWNPVIVEFYSATLDTHSGDDTPWCAAFLNWCLDRANYKGSTKTTSSGSFRKAPGLVSAANARQGDIIVFKGGTCTGHVGLLEAKSGSQFMVIGGNQTNVKGHSSINVKKLPVPGAGLTVHSFHSISEFKRAVSPRPSCP
jgi:uncharacterized protein (TIGR02594 family)